MLKNVLLLPSTFQQWFESDKKHLILMLQRRVYSANPSPPVVLFYSLSSYHDNQAFSQARILNDLPRSHLILESGQMATISPNLCLKRASAGFFPVLDLLRSCGLCRLMLWLDEATNIELETEVWLDNLILDQHKTLD